MTIKTNQSNTPLWDDNLIRRHDISGPRYTSYPTAPQFKQNFGMDSWLDAAANSNNQGNPLSLYLHIPFCETVCYYCGCNKIITANKQHAVPYLQALHKELELQAAHVDTSRPVHQLHWGGGTPTYISDDQMTALMDCTRQNYNLLDDDSGEYSIEIHPVTMNGKRMSKLRELGFNRISLGVQDFDPEVQNAVNRFNSETEVNELILASRDLGFKSLSMDLIYGLPKQNTNTFADTLDKVIKMRPDRLSLFNYAHMPHLFKVQKQINTADLPEPQEKLQILHNSINQLTDAGYVYIGMDHFALPEDELASAQKNGVLHRNFQGYATHGGCDLLAFGVSAINSLGNTHCQNYKQLDQYVAALETDQLPLAKGIALTQDDLIRASVIKQIICHYNLNFENVEKQWDISFKDYFKDELEQLERLHTDGLIDLSDKDIQVGNTGRLLIRRVCMVFDSYLDRAAAPTTNRYSRII